MGFAEVLGEVEKSMGILSGLKNLGLGNLENMDVFEGQKKQEAKKPEPVVAQKPQEKDLIYERSFTCPVCDTSFTSKVMKSNKARLLGTDQDLRPRYDGIDAAKYEVVMCPVCGCAALMRYFTTITSAQAKLIRDNICQVLKMKPYQGETYTYEHALERYQLALAEAVVKRSKTSERAYICLKYAWLVRGYAEDLKGWENPDEKQLAELAALLKRAAEQEQDAVKHNFFTEARQTEMFPLCGMNEITVDYLLSVLAVRFKDYQVAVKLLGSIITSTSANARIKDRARDMKEQVVKELKKMQG